MECGASRLQQRDELLDELRSPGFADAEVAVDEAPDARSDSCKLAGRLQKQAGPIETAGTADPFSKNSIGERASGALQRVDRGLMQVDQLLQRGTRIADTPHQPSCGYDVLRAREAGIEHVLIHAIRQVRAPFLQQREKLGRVPLTRGPPP